MEHMAGVKIVDKERTVDVLEYPIVDTLLIVQGKTPTVLPPAMIRVERMFVQVVPPRVFVKRTWPELKNWFVFESRA
jgi:hypothetical protein